MKKNIVKTNSSYRYGCYHVGRTDMWGWYCPETGEHYLAHDAGEYIATHSYCWPDENGHILQDDENGYTYEVVRELLQLGHLTARTLASFIEADGEVWWDQEKKGGSI